MPEKFAPARWRPAPASAGPATPLTVDVVHPVDGAGAEDVLVRPDGHVVTGVADGRIFAVNPDNGSYKLVADTGGRPLGIEQHPDGGLVVCDAARGLLYVSPEGDVRTLYDQDLTFTNNAAVAADGTIYFSDSTRRFTVDSWMGDVIEHQRTGRLLRRTPDGQVDVVADGFAFANGVALAPDESFVVVAQTSDYDLQRITLTGPDQGARTRFGGALPGFPDNIAMGDDGNVWIAIAAPRVPALDFLGPRHPAWRKLVWALPDALKPKEKPVIHVRALALDGSIAHDRFGRHPDFGNPTGVRRAGPHVWLGSLFHPAIARFTL
jgi:sugar lactone lactonase YvrE